MNGFPQVASDNWFKVPVEWIEMSIGMCRSEYQVMLYVIRHTWGSHAKQITLDEFKNGRVSIDGSRMDLGTGLGLSAIKFGIKRAIEHGFLDVRIDGNRRFYSVRFPERNAS